MRKRILAAIIIGIVGVLAGVAMVLIRSNPAREWLEMVQTLVSQTQTLKIHGIVKVNGTFIEKNITIGRNHPKFQTALDLISRSKFEGKHDVPPPYPISHVLQFYLDDGQWISLSYYGNTLWWKSVYHASVDPEFEKALNSILLE